MTVAVPDNTVKPRYEGKLASREAKAQLEVERKRTRLAIPYNKGPYMYISDDMDPKTFGKK